MMNIILKLALNFFESLHNSVGLDSVLQKATGGSVPKNEENTLPLASMFKIGDQGLRLALFKGSTSVFAPPPHSLASFYLRTEKGPVSETLFPFSLFAKLDDGQKPNNPQQRNHRFRKRRECLQQLKE
jgi:hypothetical protein